MQPSAIGVLLVASVAAFARGWLIPAAAFAPYDARYARLLEGGRRELAALVHRADIAFAASRFTPDSAIFDSLYRTRRIS